MNKPRLGQVRVRKVDGAPYWWASLWFGGRWIQVIGSGDRDDLTEDSKSLQKAIDAIIAEAKNETTT